ncbi:hypothetical protein INR49_021388 [Caranx melampygus]|nr:hypothetical protein INR49_021388 [Caranx melampygus]
MSPGQGFTLTPVCGYTRYQQYIRLLLRRRGSVLLSCSPSPPLDNSSERRLSAESNMAASDDLQDKRKTKKAPRLCGLKQVPQALIVMAWIHTNYHSESLQANNLKPDYIDTTQLSI